jgi:hypothetical protein
MLFPATNGATNKRILAATIRAFVVVILFVDGSSHVILFVAGSHQNFKPAGGFL